MVEHLDQMGYDEVFIGEHHSGGWEIIGSPEMFLSMAAARTSRIRLGTGVVSLGYHHPLLLADRMVLLDHLSQGRLVMGVGPGALPADSEMLGIPYGDLRTRMEESLEAIHALLTDPEPISRKTDWFELVDARLNLQPFSDPCFEIIVAATVSPSGPRLAGRYGFPLLSLAATSPGAFDVLASHWDIACEQAEMHGVTPPSRASWRLVAPMHIAETRAEAEAQVEGYLDEWATYFFRNPRMYKVWEEGLGITSDTTPLEKVRKLGIGVVGTPDDAIEKIRLMQEASGGFGHFVLLGVDWSSEANALRSLSLIAEEVMPAFQGTTARRQEWWTKFLEGVEGYSVTMANAIEGATRKHKEETARAVDGSGSHETGGPAT